MPQENFPIEPSSHYNFPLPSDSNHSSFVSTSMPFSIGSIPHITHTISTSPKTLPIVSSIPLLHSDLNFFAWDEAVCTILRFLGLYGHILDASVPLGQQPWSPDLLPAIKPKLSQLPTPSESVALNLWVENDNIAQYIITSRLGFIPHQLLPSAHGYRTALKLY